MSKDAELITDELVATIADRMVEAGKRVSPVTIWSEARGGSLVEIVAALERWRETRQPRTPDLQVETGLPEGLAEAIMSAAGRIWTTSQDEAEKAFNPRLTVMGERAEAALAERDEALAEFQRLNDEIDAGRERLAASNDALNSSEQTATRLEAELTTATGRADAAETREADLVQRVAVIEADLETTLAALAEERRARDELRLVDEGKDFEIAQLTLERDDSRQEAGSLRDVCQAKSEEVEWWSQEAGTVTLRAQAAEARVEDLTQRLSTADAGLAAANVSLEEERRAREELNAIVSDKNDEIARSAQALDGARQEISSLNAAAEVSLEEQRRARDESAMLIAGKNDEIALLRQDLDGARQEIANLNAAAEASLEEQRRARDESAALIAGKNDEIALLRQDLDGARQEVTTLSATCQARSEEVEKWSQEANAAAARAQAAESRGEELAQRVSVADGDLDATRASLEDARRARDESATLLASKNDELARLTQDFDGAQQQVASLSAACDAKSEEVEKWSQEASAVTSRAQAAEMRVDELLQRASSAESDLDRTRTSLDEERSAREALAAALAGKSDEFARLMQERDEGLQQIASLSDAHRTKADEVERWSLESSAANSRAQLAEQRVEELLQRASVDNANLETTRISLEEAQREREALSATLGSKSDELARLIQQHDDARQQIAMLSDTSRAKSEEVDKWTQEASAANSRAQNAEAHANDSLTRLAAREAERDEARTALAARETELVEARTALAARETELVEARTALAAEHQTAATRLAEASTQRDELQRISGELDATREQLGTLNDAKTAASAELTRVSQDASAAKERADAAERYAAQLAQRVAELAEAAAQDAQGGPHPGARADDSESAEEVAVLQRQLSAQTKAHEKALNDLRSNAEQWVVHARDLKQRLGQAGERMVFVDARSTGEVALVRRLASELERLKPDHELISRDAQQKLIAATMSLQLAQKGYQYDPATAVMSKIDS